MPTTANASTSLAPEELTKSKLHNKYPHWDTMSGGLAYGNYPLTATEHASVVVK